jgi:Family of unknown function (DUF5694)
MIMRKLLLFGIFSCFLISAFAQSSIKTKVLLLGCFHFDNPGLDVAKFENANILSAKRQQEVRAIVDKLKQFKPDKIFIESDVTNQSNIDSSIRQYNEGKFELKAGEVYQLGFRLAKELNLPTLHAIDYSEAEFPFDSLMKSATEANQSNLLARIQQIIDSIQRDFNASLTKNTIGEILLQQNSKQSIDAGVGFYFELLPAGKEGNHIGSYLTSEWWRRNMVIYENILKRLTGKEEKILVIFGSGHTALLQAMMQYNKNIELVPLETVLN